MKTKAQRLAAGRMIGRRATWEGGAAVGTRPDVTTPGTRRRFVFGPSLNPLTLQGIGTPGGRHRPGPLRRVRIPNRLTRPGVGGRLLVTELTRDGMSMVSMGIPT